MTLKPLRILHVTPTYLPATRYGGPIRSVHGLCRALAARGHDVHVYTTNVDGPDDSPVPLGSPVDVDGVKVWYFPTGLGRRLYRSPDMAAMLASTIGGFDVAHLHSVYLWPTSVAAHHARRCGVPYVLSPRGMLVRELIRQRSASLKLAWINLFERRNLAAAAAIHVTSDIEAEQLRALGLRVNRIEVIPNGIDIDEIDESREIGSEIPSPMVLYLGRINWSKGLDRLLAAAARVPSCQIVIAGNDDEDLTPSLQDDARRLGIADRVHFVGPVEGPVKWGWLRRADLFALASHSENFGIAVLEAMACGRPVLVTPEVGLASTIAARGAGVVASGEPAAFAEAMASLLSDARLRRRLGAAGRHLAETTYSWAGIAIWIEEAYERCIGERVRVKRIRAGEGLTVS